MIKKISYLILISVLLAAAGFFYISQHVSSFLLQPLQVKAPQLIEIRQGDSLRSILREMEQNQWLASSWVSSVAYRLHPELTQIKVGTYQLTPTDTLSSVLSRFTRGEEHQFAITFVEGSRFEDWKLKLSQSPYLTHRIQQMSEAAIAQAVSAPSLKLEGLFLAETYYFTAGTSDLEILKRAHQKLQLYLNRAWASRDMSLPLKSPYEALILASIIEKETAIDNERKQVASVFVNRLNRGMRLQTDPTVIYGMGDHYQGNIRKRDLKRPTPYNTYVIRGLPPTPIAMVGIASIDAALHPAKTSYLYFVANGHGGHVFSQSLSEHNRAVQHYLEQLKKTNSAQH